jgi:glutaredoxin-like protein
MKGAYMALLNESIQKQIRDVFAGLENPVKLVMFTQATDGASIECQMCADTRTLMEEVSALSDQLSLEVLDFLKDETRAKAYGIDKIPATVVLGGSNYKNYGIRFFGIPSGYEFGSLIESVLLASKGEPELSPKTMQAIQELKAPVHIQVFITPT